MLVCFRFKINQFDTGISWPDDPRKDPRDKELETMRDIYQYGQTAPDLPVQVCVTGKFPLITSFSFSFMSVSERVKLSVLSSFIKSFCSEELIIRCLHCKIYICSI